VLETGYATDNIAPRARYSTVSVDIDLIMQTARCLVISGLSI